MLKDDEYMTPKSAWEQIAPFIPKDKVIYEAFYGDGSSGEHLRELGFTVIHEPIDFFENTHLGDLIVSNPPSFTQKKEVLETLLHINKPFILLGLDASCHTSNRLLQAIFQFRWPSIGDAKEANTVHQGRHNNIKVQF